MHRFASLLVPCLSFAPLVWGCTSEDIFHDTNWKTACDIDANIPGCQDGSADGSRSRGADADAGTTYPSSAATTRPDEETDTQSK